MFTYTTEKTVVDGIQVQFFVGEDRIEPCSEIYWARFNEEQVDCMEDPLVIEWDSRSIESPLIDNWQKVNEEIYNAIKERIEG